MTFRFLVSLAPLLGLALTLAAAPREEARYVVLTAPGEHLFDSTPLGNGRLGAAL